MKVSGFCASKNEKMRSLNDRDILFKKKAEIETKRYIFLQCTYFT
jgi:hypothetical protein